MNDAQLSEMQSLLAACLSPDNVARQQAEAQIATHLNQHREVFIYGLVKLLRQSPQVQVRVLSAIILRQILPQGEPVLFSKLSDSLRSGIQSQLLAAIVHEPERYVRSQISDTVAELASVLIYCNGWPELFPALFSMCAPQQPNEGLKLCALSIIGKLSDSADNILAQVESLHSIFVASFAEQSSMPIREQAAVTCCKVISALEEASHIQAYQQFIEPILLVLQQSLAADDEDSAKRILAALIDLISNSGDDFGGKFFKKYLNPIVQLMHSISVDSNKDDGLRQYGLEVLLSLAESSEAMVRSSKSFIRHSLQMCLSMMMCVQDDPQWSMKNDENDFYDDSNYDCGEMGVDRLALVVRGNKLWPELKPMVVQFVSNKDDWRARHAGLFALAQAGEVLNFSHLPVKEVSSFIRDPHPRVRYACVQCLGQFPMDFEGICQNKWHATIYPALMEVLKDFTQPRVQMHACAALLNMVSGTEWKILKKYMQTLMNAMLAILQQAHQMVQAQAITVIAAIADTAASQFLPYYDIIVPHMKHIIQHANTKETRMLRAKAMECVSSIGMGVGKEKFRNDANDIMHMFVNMMQTKAQTDAAKANGQAAAAAAAAAASHTAASRAATGGVVGGEDDDHSQQYMLQAWARICTCLGAEFVPVLPLVVPAVFQTITHKSEGEGHTDQVHRLDQGNTNGTTNGDEEEEDDGEEEDQNVSKSGEVKYLSLSAAANSSDGISDKPQVLMYNNRVHTAAMEEKSMAMSMLCSLCYDLREHFLPYVEQSAKICLPLLSHPHEAIQSHAIQLLPLLVTCAAEAHKKGMAPIDPVKALCATVVHQLVDHFRRESDAHILQTLVVALQECIEEIGVLARECMDESALIATGKALLTLLQASHQRIALREKQLQTWEKEGALDDERVFRCEELNAGENELNMRASACIAALMKSHGPDFLPMFDTVYVEILRMLSVNSHSDTRKIAVFIIDDVFEHMGELAAKYFRDTLEPLCMYASAIEEEDGLRQACAFGIQMAAKHGGAAFQPFKDEIVRRLVASVQADPSYLKRGEVDKVGREWVPRDEEDEGEPIVDEEEEEEDDGEYEEEDDEGEDEEDSHQTERSRWSAVDNIVSALGAIAVYQNTPDLFPVWLSFLPIRDDSVEAPNVYNVLLGLIEQNHPGLMGSNGSNLPRLVSIMLALVGTDMLKDKALRKRVGNFFRTIKQSPPQMLQSLAATLPQPLQKKLMEVLNTV